MKYYLAIDLGATSGRHVVGYIKDVIDGGEGVAVDATRLRLDKNALLVGTHNVVLHTRDTGSASSGGIEEHPRLLARTERAGHDLFTVGRYLCIALPVGQRLNGGYSLRAEHTRSSDILQRELLSRHHLRDGHEQRGT